MFDEGIAEIGDDGLDADDDGSVPIDLPLPPPPGSGRWLMALPDGLGGRPSAEVKKEPRDANVDLVLHLTRFTGLSHREVNGRLNRLSGVQKVSEATADDFRRRADQAERWITRL